MRSLSYGAAIFFSAALLFWIQPLIGKVLLPALGGGASVWIACLAAFQLALLIGYLWSAALAKLPQLWMQCILHAAVVSCAFWQLPPQTDWPQITASHAPVLETWRHIGLRYGLLLAVLATTSPLLQHWYARSFPQRDPYFLYAASNAGSLIGLLIFPFYLEPSLALPIQATLWSAGAVAFAAFLALAGVQSMRSNASSTDTLKPGTSIAWPQALRWVGFSFLAASLLSGFTEYLSRDIAPVPMLWIIPLGLYLLGFILAFSGDRWKLLPWMHRITRYFTPVFIITASLLPSDLLMIALWLPLFFACCCTLLFRLRLEAPEAGHLTIFYLCLALGGVLGGGFNAMLAPILFNGTPEFSLVLALSLLALPKETQDKAPVPEFRWLWPAVLLLIIVCMEWLLRNTLQPYLADNWLMGFRLGVLFLSLKWCMEYRRVPAQCVAMLLAACIGMQIGICFDQNILFRARNFYGALKVSQDWQGSFHTLQHGTTSHGKQNMTETEGAAPTPLSYYHFSGPAGEAVALFRESKPSGMRAGIIGLGAGSMNCLMKAGESVDFYEIDPMVIRVAGDPRYFTYLRDCPPKTRVIEGDARRMLAESGAHYDMMALDAFSSDAIPIHLLTREAVTLYLSLLAEDGMLLVHVSNRYLSLPRVLNGHASALSLKIVERFDNGGNSVKGKEASHWVVLTRSEALIAKLKERGWVLPGGEAVDWTDTHSALWSIWR
ncbi:MAG: fused MFS/spermidine synthase [Alphaproteobacteria bacterium]|nr:fused MFS/spermidine synthase [Alphaproteobacteria bacterium]